MSFDSILAECFQSTQIASNRTVFRTSKYVTIEVDSTSTIIYNSILNIPVILEPEALEWFKSHDIITADLYDSLDKATKSVVELLLRSYLYFPLNENEKAICHRVNSKYMNEFASGTTFSWLDLRISESCNLGCSHCIAGGATTGHLMTFLKAKEVITDYVEFQLAHNPKFDTLRIHFGNCEPLINFQVIKQVIEFCSREYPFFKHEYSLNTNLTLLTPEMATLLVEKKVEVYTSLDGPQNANDRIRVYKNGTGTYQDITSKMDMMKDAGRIIDGISVTVTDSNFPFLGDIFIQWCCDMGFKSVALDFDLINSSEIPIHEKVDFLSKLWIQFTKLGIEFFGTWMTPFINLCNHSSSTEALAFCNAMFGKNISVDSFGNIYACSYSSTPICHFSNLLKAISPNGRYYVLVQNHLVGATKYSDCNGCIIEGACNGQCNMTRECCSDMNELNRHCDFYKAVTKQMLITQVNLMKEVYNDEGEENA